MTLADHIANEFRAWRTPMSLHELARRVRARDADVLAVLRSDPRFAESVSEPRRTYYLSAPFAPPSVPREGRGMPGTGTLVPGSQCARLLALLQDGNWHTTSELLRFCPCIVHSRVAELRGRGFHIEHERTGPGAPGSRYRLSVSEQEPDGFLPSPRSPRGPIEAVADPTPSESASCSGQLSLEAAI